MKCQACGAENPQENSFCTQCGAKLSSQTNQNPPATQSQTADNQDDVKAVVTRRFEAIKNKDEKTINELFDESYSKFDDWPPYQRQERAEATQNEFSAFKVLTNYSYEIKDFKETVLGDVSLATFNVHYQANMRDQQFDVTSRVTVVLKRQGDAWKLVHEHLSRYPSQTPQNQQNQQNRRRFPF